MAKKNVDTNVLKRIKVLEKAVQGQGALLSIMDKFLLTNKSFFDQIKINKTEEKK